MEEASSQQGQSSYLDFELQIGVGTGREYPVTVLRSPGGEVHTTMRFPYDEVALELRLSKLQIALLRSGGQHRRIPSSEEQAVQDLGRTLFNALFSGPVRTCYDVSLREAARQEKGLRLKLRIRPPELNNLPWEFLYNEERDAYLCLSRRTPIVRYLEATDPVRLLTVTPPLRVLGMVAGPEGLPKLDIESEKQIIDRATRSLRRRGLLELEWLPGQTSRDLQEAMWGGPWHVFHFIGHGGFDVLADEGFIALADGQGGLDRLHASRLARLVADHSTLRLVLLNACEGAKGSARDVYSSTASILVRQGILAVVAMQYDITDRAAIEFARAFYRALAFGMAVDEAVVAARKAIDLSVTNTVEWGTPVLYMRSPDGVLFKMAESTPRQRSIPPPSDAPAELDEGLEPGHQSLEPLLDRTAAELASAEIARLLAAAEHAAEAADWPQAIPSLEAVLKLDADHEGAAARLVEAREALKQQEAERERLLALTRLYEEAVERVQAEDWSQAERLLRQVQAVDPHYQEVRTLLARATQEREEQEKRQRLDDLYQEAQQAYQAGLWQAVLDLLAQIEELDPAHPDPDGLQPAAERARERDSLYELALKHLEAKEWAEAVSHLEAVDRLEPGYRDVAALLDRARAALPHPSIAVKLSVKPDPVEAGQEARWTVSLHNNGDEDLHGVTLEGRHLPSVEPFDLAVGRRRRFTFTTRHAETGDRSEKVSVTGLDSTGREVGDEAHATVHVTPAVPRPSVSVTLSVNPMSVQLNQKATWTLTLHNNGNEDLDEIQIRTPRLPDQKPFSLAVGQRQSFTFTTSYDAAESDDSIGGLPFPHKTETVSVTAVGSSGQRVSAKTSATVWIGLVRSPRSLAAARGQARTRKAAKSKSTRASTQRTPVGSQPSVAGTGQQWASGDRPKKALQRWPDPDPAEVFRILKEFSQGGRNDRLYLEPDIPPDKLRNAIKSYEVPEDAEILALLDTSERGDAKDCLLFGTQAVYCLKYPRWIPKRWHGTSHVFYRLFPSRTIERSADQESVVKLGRDEFDVKSSGVPPKEVVKLLNAIRELVMQSQA